MCNEELAHRVLDELDANHLVSKPCQERQVLGFAAQRYEDPSAGPEPIRMLGQVGVGPSLVEASPAFLPARTPKCVIHRRSVEWRMVLRALSVTLTVGAAACGPQAVPTRVAPSPTAASSPTLPFALQIERPIGPDCLTTSKVDQTLASLLPSVAPDTALSDLRLVDSTCHKRAYVVGTARLVVWDIEGYVRGKATKISYPLPTEPCIERALAQAYDLVPFAEAIIKREIAQDPQLWRDPDVGLVSWLECDGDEPKYETIATMLHETNHRVSRGKCIFDFSAKRDICFELEDTGLPPAIIAAYPKAPGKLDSVAASEFLRIQQLYLEQNGQHLRELLDEVMAYRIEAELYAVGVARNLYPAPGVTTFNNLPIMMALATRYVNELATRDPQRAATEFGPQGRNRDQLIALLDQAEASYKVWLKAVGKPRAYEGTLFADYERSRKRWLDRD